MTEANTDLVVLPVRDDSRWSNELYAAIRKVIPSDTDQFRVDVVVRRESDVGFKIGPSFYLSERLERGWRVEDGAGYMLFEFSDSHPRKAFVSIMASYLAEDIMHGMSLVLGDNTRGYIVEIRMAKAGSGPQDDTDFDDAVAPPANAVDFRNYLASIRQHGYPKSGIDGLATLIQFHDVSWYHSEAASVLHESAWMVPESYDTPEYEKLRQACYTKLARESDSTYQMRLILRRLAISAGIDGSVADDYLQKADREEMLGELERIQRKVIERSPQPK